MSGDQQRPPERKTRQSAERKAYKFVMEDLDFQGVYQHADELQGNLAAANAQAIEARSARRALSEQMEQRETELVAEHRPQFSSDTAFRNALSGILQADASMADLRAKERRLHTDLEIAEAAARECEFGLRAAAARMTALGGLLSYLAVVKTPASADGAESEKAT